MSNTYAAHDDAAQIPVVAVTKAWNKAAGVFEAIAREPYTTGMEFGISSADVGCKVGDIFRVSIRNVDDAELYEVEVVAS